jgi:hypothetical protein
MAAKIRFWYHTPMQTDGEEKPLTTEELLRENNRIRESWLNAEMNCRAEQSKKKTWMFIALAILCVCLYNAKTKMVWYPDLDDGGIREVDYYDWWGIKQQTFHPVWCKPTGEDYEQWCIKYPDGTWQTFEAYDASGETAWVTFPPKH